MDNRNRNKSHTSISVLLFSSTLLGRHHATLFEVIDPWPMSHLWLTQFLHRPFFSPFTLNNLCYTWLSTDGCPVLFCFVFSGILDATGAFRTGRVSLRWRQTKNLSRCLNLLGPAWPCLARGSSFSWPPCLTLHPSLSYNKYSHSKSNYKACLGIWLTNCLCWRFDT